VTLLGSDEAVQQGDEAGEAGGMGLQFELASNAGIRAYVARRVAEILQLEQLSRFVPETPQHRACIEAMVPAGAVTPAGIVRVACECVVVFSGGMSSYYGFEGYFVSLLVCIPEGCIWDARVEEAF
jgi:hypothetical protein